MSKKSVHQSSGWVEVGAWEVNVGMIGAVARKLRGHKAGLVCEAPAAIDYKGYVTHGRWSHPVPQSVDGTARKLMRQRFGKVEETPYDNRHGKRRTQRKAAFF